MAVGSNGHLTFGTVNDTFSIVCLPMPTSTYAVGPYWVDQRTDTAGSGIFTSTSGVAPNRIFNIEYRTTYFSGGALNYEVQLFEGQTAFDVIYGTVSTTAGNDSQLTVGVQKSSSQFTLVGCDATGGKAPPVSAGQLYHYTLAGCGTPTPTVPPTPTVTPSGTVPPTPTATPSGTPVTGPLWYNGDLNAINGLANERDTSLGAGQFASVYDNFNVTGSGWTIKEAFSDNLENTNVTGATWEIRSGTTLLSTGGTLVASGMTVTPVVTPTGRSAFGFLEFEVKVIGLSVSLPVLPTGQFYWLNVTPIGDLSGRSFDSDTSGANCVGTPCGNDGNAFFNSNFFGVTFGSTADQGQPGDFSMGVNGTGGGGGTPTATATATIPPTATPSGTPVTGPLWYNGDLNAINGLANEQDTSLGAGQFASVYDNFNVTGSGWTIMEAFSDNLENTNVTGATWEIRSGTTLLSTGGTLVASGMTTTPVVTPTGRSAFGFLEFEIKVIGLSVSLPVLPTGQFYWLNVTPIGDLSGRSFDSDTSGANCVGTPCGNDGNAFFNSNFFGVTFGSTADQGQPGDFSMGVNGTGGTGTPHRSHHPQQPPHPLPHLQYACATYGHHFGITAILMPSTAWRTSRTPPSASGQFASVYDNFNVTGSGWTITEPSPIIWRIPM